MSEFRIRPYSKTQLACLYFPGSGVATARRRLMRWIARCKPLVNALDGAGYSNNNRWFSPRQVGLIAEFLGVPDIE